MAWSRCLIESRFEVFHLDLSLMFEGFEALVFVYQLTIWNLPKASRLALAANKRPNNNFILIVSVLLDDFSVPFLLVLNSQLLTIN